MSTSTPTTPPETAPGTTPAPEPAAEASAESRLTVDALTPEEALPPRSRTFSPEVVKAVNDYLNPAEGKGVGTLGVGTFDSEGQARSALTTLNRMLRELHNAPHTYAGTVRELNDGRYRAIILNKAAKERAPLTDAQKAAAAKRRADAKKAKETAAKAAAAEKAAAKS